MAVSWKPNWEETKQHYCDWWNRKGLVLSSWGGLPSDSMHEPAEEPPPLDDLKAEYETPAWRAAKNHYEMAHRVFPGDIVPISSGMIGPGSLALVLGAQPGYSPETVWFDPTMAEDAQPEARGPLTFDASNRYFQLHRDTCRACVGLGRGKYLTGFPDLVENVDILAALRDPQTLMFDMAERPAWIEEKVMEINQVYVETYQRLYDIIKEEDGSSAFGCFGIWGPGKTAKVQCDAAAMFSPAMFKRFVVPALSEQCEWLDCSLFHLDGTQCIAHLDLLLEIDALDAIEWTPQAGIEGGGDPRWYDLYRRILAGGKSVQAIGVQPDEVVPLLDACGAEGMYIMVNAQDAATFEQLVADVEPYR